MRNITRASIALIGAVALTGATAMSASAETVGNTDTTASIEAGLLSITVPATLTLTSTAPGEPATGTVGAVTVIDDTASNIGWEATITVSDFVPDATATALGAITIAASEFDYTALAADTTGSAVVPIMAAVAMVEGGTDVPVQTTVTTNGNNIATWTANVSLAIPTTAIAGSYDADLTHSVL